jgi:FkbM family methyltransferase
MYFASQAARLGRQIVRSVKPLVDGYPRVGRLYRDMRELRWARRQPVDTPLGFKLAGSPVMEQGTFEPEETALFTSLLPKVDLFVNVGANVGYYCCIALQHGVSTVAVEPMPGNLRHLYNNIEANGWSDRVEVFPMALARRSGLRTIYGAGTGASLIAGWAGTPSHYKTIVPATTLDRLLSGRISGRRALILADVEGAELEVLAGAGDVLAASPKPIWLVEIAIDHHQAPGVRINPLLRATFARFWEANYESWTADARLRPVVEADVIAIERSQENFLGTQDFVFIEKGARAALLPPGPISD